MVGLTKKNKLKSYDKHSLLKTGGFGYKNTYVLVQSSSGIFGRTDGSLYVNFPYYKHSRGLISIATITGRTSFPTTVDLVPGGKVTSHLVKYSHHPDGRAHFSQDGKVRSIVRKQSNTFRETEGHIFTIQLQGLQGFTAVDIEKDFSTPVDKKAVVTFALLSSTINYEAFKLVGRWHSKTKFMEGIRGKVEGPLVSAMKPDGAMVPGVMISPPAESPFCDHILLISVENIGKLTKEEDTALTFIGGFDSPSVILDRELDTSFLALAYPARSYLDLKTRLGSADLSELRGK